MARLLVAGLPLLGIRLTVLSLVLLVAVWTFLVTMVGRETRWAVNRQMGFVLLALSMTWLTQRWPAGVLLFVATMLLVEALRGVCSSRASDGK